eukprot:TRINITY_DN5043_c0_g1_i3.p4 TRINITY_DN5043_c0_g1~~TRINITY_DN5043_c0_g1_i3.p4  ORF type:complete len:124 (-),score=7.58 TRINITY_DN5043_c0_g1_i3:296-667(-)
MLISPSQVIVGFYLSAFDEFSWFQFLSVNFLQVKVRKESDEKKIKNFLEIEIVRDVFQCSNQERKKKKRANMFELGFTFLQFVYLKQDLFVQKCQDRIFVQKCRLRVLVVCILDRVFMGRDLW